MQNFQDAFETRKRSFTRAFSICMTEALRIHLTFSDKGQVKEASF